MFRQASDFKNWLINIYLKRFPSPPRNNDYDWTSENVVQFGFQSVHFETFKNFIEFNKIQLINYFTTQSNIGNAVETEFSTYEQIEEWLNNELEPFFTSPHTAQTFQFGNWIRYLQKAEQAEA